MGRSNEDSSASRCLRDEWQAGDAGAFDRLFVKHGPYLNRVVSLRMDSQLRGRIDVSDVLQETHIEALRQAAAGEPPEDMPVRLWLRQIACQRLVLAHRQHVEAACRTVRREVSLPEQSSLALARQLISGSASPSEQASRREIAKRVREALARLPERDCEIILLHNFEGLTSRESAQVLGIAPPAARKRYGRALFKLRQSLSEADLGEIEP